MADRRRRPQSEGESDEESTETSSSQSPRKPRQSECESEGDVKEADIEVSDYESANEDNGEEGEEEEDDEEEEESEEEEEEDDDEEYEDEGEDVIVEDDDEVGEERQSGDGEEQPDKQKLDDDEDRKNPAFIPRQGAFYEHDLRLGEDAEEDDKRPRKKLWQDQGRWAHDKYSHYMQGPKSREELITMYGYDIRMSEKPPDAPPRRGGGPRRPRMGDKPNFGDFFEGSSRDDNYIVERKNEYNRNNRERYFRGKSEEYQSRDEDRKPTFNPGHEHEDDNSERTHNSNRNQPQKYDEWNSRFEENQSYRNRNRESNRGYDRNRDSGRRYGRNSDSGRGYGRNRDSNRNYDRGQDSYQDSNRGYEKSSRREFDNRPPRYENRNYRDYKNDSSSSYEYQRGGRYNNRGYRNDPPRREYTYSRDRGSRYVGRGGRSRPERGRGGPPRRTFESEKTIPPRFQKKKEARMYNNYNAENYVDNEQIQNYYNEGMGEFQNMQGDMTNEDEIVKTEVFTPSNVKEEQAETRTEVPEEKSDDKNENVIVQSSAGERKSYSKERRARTVVKTRVQDSALNAVQEGIGQIHVKTDAETSTKMTDLSEKGGQKGKRIPQDETEKFPASSKQDRGSSKRYSSQRQRNPDQAPVENTQFYPADVPKAFSKQEVPAQPFQQQIMRPPLNFPIPVSTSALPNAPPQRMFRPPPVSITGGVPIIPPQFINTGVIYGAPPAGAPYPVAPIQGFPSPPPVSTAPPPPIPAVSSPNQLQEVYRHGTTYYPPELQYPQIKKRSPVKRTKSAIPIVNPEDVSDKAYEEGGEEIRDTVEDGEPVDERDAKLQETIDREYGFEDQTETSTLYEHKPSDEQEDEKQDFSVTEKQSDKTENVDNEMDSLASRLTTDISNYTIAFSTEQEVAEKGDNHEETDKERNSPVLEDKNIESGERSSPVLGDKEDSSQNLAATSSSQEISVS